MPRPPLCLRAKAPKCLSAKEPKDERASGAIMRVFVNLSIVASRDEAGRLLARVMVRGK
jgi:hypothetical protein